jgi:hypothetical protein
MLAPVEIQNALVLKIIVLIVRMKTEWQELRLEPTQTVSHPEHLLHKFKLLSVQRSRDRDPVVRADKKTSSSSADYQHHMSQYLWIF